MISVELAKRYAEAVGMKDTIARMYSAFEGAMRESLEDTLNADEILTLWRDESARIVAEAAETAVCEIMDEDEALAIVEFYESQAGQSLKAKMPALMARCEELASKPTAALAARLAGMVE